VTSIRPCLGLIDEDEFEELVKTIIAQSRKEAREAEQAALADLRDEQASAGELAPIRILSVEPLSDHSEIAAKWLIGIHGCLIISECPLTLISRDQSPGRIVTRRFPQSDWPSCLETPR
jgi:hypothetical protein